MDKHDWWQRKRELLHVIFHPKHATWGDNWIYLNCSGGELFHLVMVLLYNVNEHAVPYNLHDVFQQTLHQLRSNAQTVQTYKASKKKRKWIPSSQFRINTIIYKRRAAWWREWRWKQERYMRYSMALDAQSCVYDVCSWTHVSLLYYYKHTVLDNTLLYK